MKKIKVFIRKKLKLWQILLLVIVISFARAFFDFFLLNYPLELNIFQHYTRFYLENIYYFVIVFLLVVFSLSKILKKTFIDVANFGIRIFSVIIIPPIVDHFVFGRADGYEYATTQNFLNNLFTISWFRGDATFGISLEITMALLLLGAYAYYSTKSISRTILSMFVSTVIIVFISTPEIFFGERADYFYFEFLPNYYFFPLMFLASIMLYHYKKEKLNGILSNLRILKSTIFIVFVLLGALAASSFGITLQKYAAFSAAVAIFFVWQFSIVINDIYDYKIDKISNKNRPLVKKTITFLEYKLVAWIFIFFALSFSAIINAYIFFLIILGVFLATIYSAPPLRLRKNYFGNLLIGVSLVISFVAGILSTGGLGILFEEKNITYSFVLFLLGTIVTFTKDIKDIKSDYKFGIKNFYTIFGKDKGKKIVTFLVFLILNTPSFILKNLALLPLTFIVSLLACYIYYKKEDERPVYTISALLMTFIFVKLFYF